MNYPVNYFFALVQTTLEDKRSVGIILGDGVGSSYSNKLSNEDCLTLDGFSHKLDITVLEEDPADIMSLKHLKSASMGRFDASCDLIYEPRYLQDNSVYAILIAFH